MRIAWVLSDPITSTTYELPINPDSGGTPARRKNFSYQNTAAPDGKVLMFEGREAPKTISVSGVILTEAHLDGLITWYNKRNAIELTDDLGRVYRVYITGLSPSRERRGTRPWFHTYSMEMTILDW